MHTSGTFIAWYCEHQAHYCLNEKAKEDQKVFQTLPNLPNDLKKHILTFYKFKAPITKCLLCNNFMYKTYDVKEFKNNYGIQ